MDWTNQQRKVCELWNDSFWTITQAQQYLQVLHPGSKLKEDVYKLIRQHLMQDFLDELTNEENLEAKKSSWNIIGAFRLNVEEGKQEAYKPELFPIMEKTLEIIEKNSILDVVSAEEFLKFCRLVLTIRKRDPDQKSQVVDLFLSDIEYLQRDWKDQAPELSKLRWNKKTMTILYFFVTITMMVGKSFDAYLMTLETTGRKSLSLKDIVFTRISCDIRDEDRLEDDRQAFGHLGLWSGGFFFQDLFLYFGPNSAYERKRQRFFDDHVSQKTDEDVTKRFWAQHGPQWVTYPEYLKRAKFPVHFIRNGRHMYVVVWLLDKHKPLMKLKIWQATLERPIKKIDYTQYIGVPPLFRRENWEQIWDQDFTSDDKAIETSGLLEERKKEAKAEEKKRKQNAKAEKKKIELKDVEIGADEEIYVALNDRYDRILEELKKALKLVYPRIKEPDAKKKLAEMIPQFVTMWEKVVSAKEEEESFEKINETLEIIMTQLKKLRKSVAEMVKERAPKLYDQIFKKGDEDEADDEDEDGEDDEEVGEE